MSATDPAAIKRFCGVNIVFFGSCFGLSSGLIKEGRRSGSTGAAITAPLRGRGGVAVTVIDGFTPGGSRNDPGGFVPGPALMALRVYLINVLDKKVFIWKIRLVLQLVFLFCRSLQHLYLTENLSPIGVK